MPDPVQIPIETGLDVTRRAAHAAHDAIVMEWAADIARRDEALAQVTRERDALLDRIGELEGSDDGRATDAD